DREIGPMRHRTPTLQRPPGINRSGRSTPPVHRRSLRARSESAFDRPVLPACRGPFRRGSGEFPRWGYIGYLSPPSPPEEGHPIVSWPVIVHGEVLSPFLRAN